MSRPPTNESGPREVELPQAEDVQPTTQMNRKDVAQYMPYHENLRNVCAHPAHIAHNASNACAPAAASATAPTTPAAAEKAVM